MAQCSNGSQHKPAEEQRAIGLSYRTVRGKEQQLEMWFNAATDHSISRQRAERGWSVV